MTVLHIAHSRLESGAYSFLLDELSDLVDQHCIVPWPINGQYSRNLPNDTSIVKCQYNMLYGQYRIKNWLVYRALKAYIRSKSISFSLIHGHYVFTDGHVAHKLHKDYDVPYVVSFRKSDLDIFRRRPHLRRIGFKILKEASKIVFISIAHYNAFFSEFLNIKEQDNIKEKSIVIPNGIDSFWIKRFYSQKLKKLNKPINLLTVGWIQHNKNQLNVAKAIDKLKTTFDLNIIYTVIGHPREIEYANRLKSYDFVKYLPPVGKEELLLEYRKADIFIMPSYNETFGLVYLEALTQHIPIIFTKQQGIDGFFPNAEYARSVDPNDINQISQVIKELIDSYGKLNYPKKLDFDRFKWNIIANQLFSIYKSLISEIVCKMKQG
jgi:glycosyltransferase involved in cell wall biosynthesis